MHGDRAKPAPRRAEPRGTGTPSCGRGGGVWIRPWTGHCGQPTGSPLHSNQPEWAFLSRATPKTRLTGTTPRPHPHAAEGTPREAGAPREGARRRGPGLCVLGPAGKGGSPGCGEPDLGGGRGPRPGAWAAVEAPPTPTTHLLRESHPGPRRGSRDVLSLYPGTSYDIQGARPSCCPSSRGDIASDMENEMKRSRCEDLSWLRGSARRPPRRPRCLWSALDAPGLRARPHGQGQAAAETAGDGAAYVCDSS